MPTIMYTEDEFNAIVARAETAEAAIEAIRRAAGVPSQPAPKAATVARVAVQPSKWREVADVLEAERVPNKRLATQSDLAVRFRVSVTVVRTAQRHLAQTGVVYLPDPSLGYHYR
jgi:ribosomal protein S25